MRALWVWLGYFLARSWYVEVASDGSPDVLLLRTGTEVDWLVKFKLVLEFAGVPPTRVLTYQDLPETTEEAEYQERAERDVYVVVCGRGPAGMFQYPMRGALQGRSPDGTLQRHFQAGTCRLELVAAGRIDRVNAWLGSQDHFLLTRAVADDYDLLFCAPQTLRVSRWARFWQFEFPSAVRHATRQTLELKERERLALADGSTR